MPTEAQIKHALDTAEQRLQQFIADYGRSQSEYITRQAEEIIARMRAEARAPAPGQLGGKPPVYSAAHTMKVHPSGSPEAVSSVEIRTTGCNTFHAHSQDEPRVLQGGKRYAVVLALYELDGEAP